MKIYQFYSDFNDRYNFKQIPRDVLDVVDRGAPMPEQYRDKRYDIFITGIGDWAPAMYEWEGAQIWYNKNKDEWKLDFWWTDNLNEVSIVSKKYKDTIRVLDKFPSYMPDWPLKAIISLGWVAAERDYRKIRSLVGYYNININKKGIY